TFCQIRCQASPAVEDALNSITGLTTRQRITIMTVYKRKTFLGLAFTQLLFNLILLIIAGVLNAYDTHEIPQYYGEKNPNAIISWYDEKSFSETCSFIG